jgi:hypothetical protein
MKRYIGLSLDWGDSYYAGVTPTIVAVGIVAASNIELAEEAFRGIKRYPDQIVEVPEENDLLYI